MELQTILIMAQSQRKEKKILTKKKIYKNRQKGKVTNSNIAEITFKISVS